MATTEGYPTLTSFLGELKRLESAGALTTPGGTEAAGQRYLKPGRAVDLVNWPGVGSFWLSGPQRAVVRTLLHAYLHSRNPDVDQGVLLASAGVNQARLEELFRGNEAWGLLIIRGRRPGSYRLADLPSAAAQPEAERHVVPPED